MPLLSNDFKGLYCDASVFDSFSGLHPICFRRVLPFQTRDELVDDRHLIHAEATHLTARTDDSRRRIVDEYTRCGLLQQADAVHQTVIGRSCDAGTGSGHGLGKTQGVLTLGPSLTSSGSLPGGVFLSMQAHGNFTASFSD